MFELSPLSNRKEGDKSFPNRGVSMSTLPKILDPMDEREYSDLRSTNYFCL